MPGLETSGGNKGALRRFAPDLIGLALVLWFCWPVNEGEDWYSGGGWSSAEAMAYLEEHLEGLHPEGRRFHMAVNAVAASRDAEALEWLDAQHPCVVFGSDRQTVYSVGPGPWSDSVSAQHGIPDPWEIHRRTWSGSGWSDSMSSSEVRTPHGFRVHALELREDLLALDVEDRGEARYQPSRDRWGFELGERAWIEFRFGELRNY